MKATLNKYGNNIDKPLSASDVAVIKAHFAKKADEARAFLEANPIPKDLQKK